MGEIEDSNLIFRDMVRRVSSIVFGTTLLLMAACGGANGAATEPEQQESTATIVDAPIEDNEEATGDALKAERVVISKHAMSLKLYDADNRLICRFPVAIGRSYGNKQEEGDMRTPEGEFRIAQIQQATHWVHDVGEGLIEGYYGDWFVRLDTPHRGIGIHGTNDPSSIGGRTTEGCVRLANSDLDSLRPMLKVGMVVTIEPAPSDRKANGEVVIESGQARAVITETLGDTEPANEATIAENPKPQPSNNKTVETTTEEVWHTVVDGELLGRIARSYGVTIADIKRLNPNIDVDRISIGQRIRISDGTSGVTRTEVETTTTTVAEPPAAAETETPAETPAAAVETPNSAGEVWHTVVDGELLGRIARSYGVTIADIKRLNPNIDVDRISIGQHIRISDGTNSVTRTEVETTTTTTAETPDEAPAAAVEAPNSEGEVWYTIVDGDLVGRVAARYGTTAKRIAELNPDINIDQVSIGQRIRIK